MEVTARVHEEDGSLWAEVPELPGCFASGRDVGELIEALAESIALHSASDASDVMPAPTVSAVRLVLPGLGR